MPVNLLAVKMLLAVVESDNTDSQAKAEIIASLEIIKQIGEIEKFCADRGIVYQENKTTVDAITDHIIDLVSKLEMDLNQDDPDNEDS